LQDSVFMSIFVADYTKHFSLMVKRLLLFFLLTGCFAVARAQWKGLVVQQADGSTITIALSEHPTIYFEGGEIVIRTNSGAEYNFSPTQELEMNFSESLTGIKDVLTQRRLSLKGDYLVLSSEKKGAAIRVFTAGGRLSLEAAVDADGKAVVDLSKLPKGIYIIQTPSLTQKIIKK